MNNNKIKISSNKSFGIVFFLFFFVISILPFFYNESIRLWSLIISLVFLVLGILKSNLLTPLNKIWFKFGILLGGVISPIVMGLIFFLLLTPISLVLKLFKKDILNLKINNSKTYWITKSGPKSKMKNQF